MVDVWQAPGGWICHVATFRLKTSLYRVPNMNNIKTPSDLKYAVESAGHESHFFTRKTMSFFGDTMRNYGVRKITVLSAYDADGNYVGGNGVERAVYELYRKQAVKHGLSDSAYFDAETFRRVHVLK